VEKRKRGREKSSSDRGEGAQEKRPEAAGGDNKASGRPEAVQNLRPFEKRG